MATFSWLEASVTWVGALNSTCGMKADPACQWLPIFTDHFPPVKWHPKKYRCWEENDERNTGHLGKKKMLYKFCWQERAGSFPNRIPSSIFLFRFHSRAVWRTGCFGEENRGHSLTGHTQNNISTVLRPINPPGSISFVRMHIGWPWITKYVQLKGVEITPRKTWGSYSWGTSYLFQFVDSILQLSFWGAVIFLLKNKKKGTAYACTTSHLQWFHKHLCTMDSQGGKSRNTSLQGENPPMDLPLWGLCLPPVPALQLEGQTNSEKTMWTSFTRSAPSPLSAGLLWYLQGSYQFYGDFANEVWTDSSRVQAKKVSRRGCGILLN